MGKSNKCSSSLTSPLSSSVFCTDAKDSERGVQDSGGSTPIKIKKTRFPSNYLEKNLPGRDGMSRTLPLLDEREIFIAWRYY